MGLHQAKNFCKTKESINKTGCLLNGRKYLQLKYLVNDWYLKYIKNVYNSTSKTQRSQLKNGQRTWIKNLYIFFFSKKKMKNLFFSKEKNYLFFSKEKNIFSFPKKKIFFLFQRKKIISLFPKKIFFSKKKHIFSQRRYTDGWQTHKKTVKSLIIRGMQTNIKMRSHLALFRRAIIKKSTNNTYWEGCGENGTLVQC